MRPEDFQDRPTVNPTTKRIYAYGQMLFGAVVGTATVIGAVYTFLGNYSTDGEVREAIDKNNLDLVEAGKSLPHDLRFRRTEEELTALRRSVSELQKDNKKLKSISTESLELLAGYLAADSEKNPNLRFRRGEKARQDFRDYLSKGEPPMNAFRLAMRPPGPLFR